MLGILCGFEDLNDHDTLRDDALLALAVGKKDPRIGEPSRAAARMQRRLCQVPPVLPEVCQTPGRTGARRSSPRHADPLRTPQFMVSVSRRSVGPRGVVHGEDSEGPPGEDDLRGKNRRAPRCAARNGGVRGHANSRQI